MAPIDLFDLYAKITLDTGDYESGLENASGKTDSFSDKLKSGLATAAKVGAAAVTAASAAVTALTKNSIEQYGEYEQLVGGVETLFKTSADIVQGYADNAFNTAGLSANEYMETVTSFSASLLQSLENDTEAAAQKADLAITDMADNANKMGTSMESIQNAYQGFAKQNYTMLDNLKLGYGGTKEEMERLLEDATALSGVEYDISSYADIVDAIHVIQTEMGITGTTALEASTTIQGSISSAISTWKNLVTGIADEDADLDTLIGNFVGSVETAAGNVIPRITQILSGMGTAIQQLAPIIATEVPALASSVLPQIISAGAQLVVGLATGLIGALPELVAAVPEIVASLSAAISESLPELTAAGTQLLSMLAAGVMTGIPLLAETASNILSKLSQYLKENLPTLLQSGLEMLDKFTGSLRENAGVLVDAALEFAKNLATGLAAGIPTIVEQVPSIVSNIANIINDNAPKILKAGIDIILTLVKGLIDSIPVIVENLPQIISAIVDVITAFNWVSLGAKVINFFSNGIKGALSSIVDAAKEIVSSITDGGGLKNLPEIAKQWGQDLIQNFINGIKKKISALKDTVSNVAQTVKDFLGFSEPKEGPLSNFHTYAPDMMQLFADGIKDNSGLLKNAFNQSLDFGTANVDFASSGLGMSSAGIINSVSAAGAAEVGSPLLVNLMLPDGTKFATWQLPYLIKAAQAAGTPIASGQYA